MAKIVLTCWGSHGDVDPFVGLALGLQARGHEVSVATLEYFRSVITQSGLDFHPIRPKADPSDTALVQRLMDRNRGPEYLLREIIFPGVEAMYEDLGAAIQGADLLISHPLTVAAPILAEERGLPWASTVLAPASFFSVHDLPVLPPAPWLKHLERLGPWVARGLVGLAKGSTARWALPVAALRAKRGLPPGRTPIFDGQHSPHLVLALYSSVLGKPQADWPPNVVVTGHMFHDRAHGVALTPEVEAFLSAGPAPLVFTLGSSAVLVAGPFWDESVTAVEKLGARALLLVGPGHAAAMRPSLPADILAIDGAPHSLLFPRSAAVVQQCGIGTLAQSLRSGRPMLGVPYAHDQPDNAYRAQRLGMARVVPPHRYRARRVVRELQALLQGPSYVAAAERTAQIVRSERGIAAACEALEERFQLR